MTAVQPTGDVSLLSFLDTPNLTCLNESSDHPSRSMIDSSKNNGSSKSYLESAADEQLLLSIPFNQAVRIRSIIIRSSSVNMAPKVVKLFVNYPAIGFEDVEGVEEPTCAQTFELSEQNVKDGKPVLLKFVRFQAVNSLHIFVESNQEAEETTRIDSINIFGVPLQTTKDLSGLRNTET